MDGGISVSIRVAPTDCWACGCSISIVSALRLARGSEWLDCSIADLTDFPALVADVQKALPAKADVGPLKPRFSRTLERSYASNGCRHCGALFGAFHEFATRHGEREAASLHAGDDPAWTALLEALLTSEGGHLV